MVVNSNGDSPRLMVDCIGVCNFVSKMGGAARIMTMCLISSSNESCVVFGDSCD